MQLQLKINMYITIEVQETTIPGFFVKGQGEASYFIIDATPGFN